MKMCQENPDLLQLGQNMKTEESCILAGDIKTPQNFSVRVKRYLTVRAAEMA